MAAEYRVQILPSALRQLERRPAAARARVRDAIDGLATQPGPDGCVLLSGGSTERIYRVRRQLRNASG